MAQEGTALVTTAAPEFTKFVVVKGTWKERDTMELEETANDNDGTINIAGDDPGVDATCEWVVKDGQTPAAKLDVIADDAATPRKFVVVDVETSNYGVRAIRQTVTLRYKESLASELS